MMQFSFRIMHLIGGIFVASILLIVIFETANYRTRLDELSNRSKTTNIVNAMLIAQSIDHQARLGDWQSVQQRLRRVGELDSHFHVRVIAPDGMILADGALIEPSGQANLPIVAQTLDKRSPTTLPGDAPDTFSIGVPLNDPAGAPIAVLVSNVDMSGQLASLRADVIRDTLAESVLVAFLFGAIFILLWTQMTAPLEQLRQVANAVTRGSLAERAPHFRLVELEQVGRAFDQMLDRLREQQIVLEDLNLNLEDTVAQRTQELAARNRELTALYETSLEINTQPDIPALLHSIVERATSLTSAGIGGVYLLLPDEQTLELVVAHNILDSHIGTRLRLGEGVSGRVAQTGQLLMIDDYRHWEGRAMTFDDIPFSRVLGVPLKIGDRVLGVINLSDRIFTQSFTPDEIRVVKLFADQAAIAVENQRLYEQAERELAERKQAEAALQQAKAELENRVAERTAELQYTNTQLSALTARLQYLFTSNPAVIYSLACDDLHFTFISDNAQTQFGYAAQEFLTNPIFWINRVHPQEQLDLIEAQKHATEYDQRTYEYRFRHADGTWRWLRDDTKLMRDAEGKPYELVGSMIDITARKHAEEQIQTALEEKVVLLKEIHHRVKNNLQLVSSLLNLQSQQLADRASVEMLRDSQNRVRSMALIHERLYQSADLAQIDFADYVRGLAAYLLHSYKVNPAAVAFQVVSDAPIHLSIDQAIPCGLIVNELLSNSFKHAFPAGRAGIVQIIIEQTDAGQCRLTIGDDGVGLPLHIDFRQTASLGLQLVTTLVEQISGSIERVQRPGTVFIVEFTAK